MKLDNRELAIVLAGLRMIQRVGLRHEEHGIATNGGEFDYLDDGAIDDLCERINTTADPVVKVAGPGRS